ncbi:hypothetical protein LCGC14_1631470 [marine sediment metagenome]|uniref:Uncharacterized protein n=1 Tax=marine sediment metagenome TaxID=412755 RepID=A0A0F9I2S0_9ZZZZ
MTDDERKITQLMAAHAAKVRSQPKKQESRGDVADIVRDWDLDPRPARVVCPDCKKERSTLRPRGMWKAAERRGEKDPVWESPCEKCSREPKRQAGPPAPEISQAPELEFPTLEER